MQVYMQVIRLISSTRINTSCGQSLAVAEVLTSVCSGAGSPAAVASSANRVVPPPALHTAMSMPPSSPAAAATARSAAARSARSTSRASTRTPCAAHSCATVAAVIRLRSKSYTAAASRLRSRIATSAPNSASRSA